MLIVTNNIIWKNAIMSFTLSSTCIQLIKIHSSCDDVSSSHLFFLWPKVLLFTFLFLPETGLLDWSIFIRLCLFSSSTTSAICHSDLSFFVPIHRTFLQLFSLGLFLLGAISSLLFFVSPCIWREKNTIVLLRLLESYRLTVFWHYSDPAKYQRTCGIMIDRTICSNICRLSKYCNTCICPYCMLCNLGKVEEL